MRKRPTPELSPSPSLAEKSPVLRGWQGPLVAPSGLCQSVKQSTNHFCRHQTEKACIGFLTLLLRTLFPCQLEVAGDKGNKVTLRTLSGSILAFLLPTTSILGTDTRSSTKGHGVFHLLFPPRFSVVLLARDASGRTGASFTESRRGAE